MQCVVPSSHESCTLISWSPHFISQARGVRQVLQILSAFVHEDAGDFVNFTPDNTGAGGAYGHVHVHVHVPGCTSQGLVRVAAVLPDTQGSGREEIHRATQGNADRVRYAGFVAAGAAEAVGAAEHIHIVMELGVVCGTDACRLVLVKMTTGKHSGKTGSQCKCNGQVAVPRAVSGDVAFLVSC